MKSTTDLNKVNAYIPGRADVGASTTAMIQRCDVLLGPAYRLMYEHPLHIVRGEGAWLIDADGRRFLDVYNNVTSLGHCHPAVSEAICRQVQTLATNTRYLHDTILELVERLLATVPETSLAHLMLTCTGSEANDLAYRIAKMRTGGSGIIVTETAYHGITDAVSQFSPSLGTSVDLGPHVRLIPAPCHYHAEGVDLNYREIVECYNVSGGYDYLLKIIAPNIALFQDLMDRLLEDEIGIDKFASRIVLRQPYQQRAEPLQVIAKGKSSWK